MGKDLMSSARPYTTLISPTVSEKLVCYCNRNSLPFREFYKIPEAETVMRGSLRYGGFPAFVKALVDIGFMDEGKKPWLVEGRESVLT